MANVYQSQYSKIAIRALNADTASYFSGSVAAALEILDEGSTLTTSVTSIDFVGAGVNATNAGSAVTVTIPGGGSTDTGSLLTTASAAGNTITFTKGDGSTFPVTVAGGTGAPGGSNTQIQFNSGSTFSGSGNLRFDYVTNTIHLTGSISASSGANTVGFFGTASWAQSASQASDSLNAVSSSYAGTSSLINVVNNAGGAGNYEVLFVADPESSQIVYGDSNRFYYFPATQTLTAKNFSGTSSFITASNVWGPFGSSSVQSASYASSSTSASYALTASYAIASNPAPSDTYIQFNQNGAFGANANFRFIYNSSSLEQGASVTAPGDYSHAQGGSTVALGFYSHAEGTSTYTGLINAYSASISSGVVTLWDAYPDLSSDFLPGDYIIYNDNIGSDPSVAVVDSATYSSPNTIITLTDLSINVASTIIGNANKNVASWTGDQTSLNEFGFSSHAEGTFTYALGVISHAEGRDTAAFKEGSNTKGKGTVAVGTYQSVIGTYNALNTSSYSFIIGDGTADNNRHNLLFASGSWFEVSASNVFLQGLPASSETHILIYNTSSGQVYYTASSAIGGGGGSTFPFSGSAVITGSLLVSGSGVTITGSLNVTNGITGSLFGTASYVTGSVFNSTNPALSASYALSSSQATSASYAQTASYAVNLIVSGGLTQLDYIDFDTASAALMQAARLKWDNGESTLQLGLGGGNVDLNVGEQLYQYVYNAQGAPLTKGQVVYVSSSQGGRIAVKLASATAEQGSANTLGFVAETIDTGLEGWVMTEGSLRGVNTANFTPGGLIYLSSSAGEYTQTPQQAPLHSVRLGYAQKIDNATGIIYVKVDNGYELDELHDVRIISDTSGDLLVRSSSLWVNSKQLTGSYGLTGSLQATSFTGSLFGTASWADSASQALTASYVTGSIFTSTNPALSASYALTASHALNGGGSFTSTSSFIGNGLSSSFNINHGFNTRNLHITVYESGSNGETVYPDIRRINANTASIIFANPPTADQYIVYISQ